MKRGCQHPGGHICLAVLHRCYSEVVSAFVSGMDLVTALEAIGFLWAADITQPISWQLDYSWLMTVLHISCWERHVY